MKTNNKQQNATVKNVSKPENNATAQIEEVKNNRINREPKVLASAKAEQELDINLVFPSSINPRKTFKPETIEELSQSIKQVGLLNSIAVRPRKEGGYEIIYGERRYRALKLLEAKTIKSVIHDVSEEEAEDMSYIENLQREDISPTEEAVAFRRLIDSGRYDMYDLTSRFGKSEKYIYTRLKLNDLYQPIADLLNNGEIFLSVAEEIATYEPEIQKDIYEKYLKDEKGWRNFGLKLFRTKFENAYTTDLNNYKFDKSECANCPHNAANYNLFAEHDGQGQCTDRNCLDKKNTDFLLKQAETMLKNNPNLILAKDCYCSKDTDVLNKLDKKGYEVKQLNYKTHTRTYPVPPAIPEKENYLETKDFEKAVEDFHKSQSEYENKMETIRQKQKEGSIHTYLKIGSAEPILCYEELNKKEKKPLTINELQQKDKRNKEIAQEKTITDLRKVLYEEEYSETPFTSYEDGMLYYILLDKLQDKHYKLFGINEKYYLESKTKVKIVGKLTEEQKTLIKRDFINSYLREYSHDQHTSKLLLDFAKMHYPDKFNFISATHDEEYQQRHLRLMERIEVIKVRQKASEQKEKKQQTEKTDIPAKESPEAA